MRFRNDYTADWPEIAQLVKETADWRCVRCGHPAESPKKRRPCDERCDPARHPSGLNDGRRRVLTIHHLNGDKADNRWFNLLALCQVCHLVIQAKVDVHRPWLLFEHSEWFKPYVAGFYAWKYLNEELTYVQTMGRLEELLALEYRPWTGHVVDGRPGLGL
jgi:hypothetical protein